jgi:hypothetical protein
MVEDLRAHDDGVDFERGHGAPPCSLPIAGGKSRRFGGFTRGARAGQWGGACPVREYGYLSRIVKEAAMRERYDISGFGFEVGPAPGDARRLRVLMFKDGEPFTDLHGAQMEKTFAPGAGEARMEQFCRRFATDGAYRTQVMLKHAFACC